MMTLLLKIQESDFCQWVRQSESLFAYAGILFLHTVGMGFVVGINATIDLRILGFAPGVPIAPLERFLPVMWFGFWVNAITGTILLAADATHKLANVDFYIKMGLIALAVLNVRMLQTHVFRDEMVDKEPPLLKAKILAATSLVLWCGAIVSGRLLAYVGPGSGAR